MIAESGYLTDLAPQEDDLQALVMADMNRHRGDRLEQMAVLQFYEFLS